MKNNTHDQKKLSSNTEINSENVQRNLSLSYTPWYWISSLPKDIHSSRVVWSVIYKNHDISGTDLGVFSIHKTKKEALEFAANHPSRYGEFTFVDFLSKYPTTKDKNGRSIPCGHFLPRGCVWQNNVVEANK